jgi:PRC-barrel domain/Domain of unknown function (DUF2382)
MAELREAGDYRGRFLCDSNGERIGTIDEVYLDAETDQPDWGLVNTGQHGTRLSFVPLRDSVAVGDEDVRVPLPPDRIMDAATIEPDGELSAEEEAKLYEHYGMDYLESPSGARSEEGLRPGTAGEGRSRLRLKRYIVTEHVPTTIPVQREELRLERDDDVRP